MSNSGSRSVVNSYLAPRSHQLSKRHGRILLAAVLIMSVLFQGRGWSETPLFATGNVLATLAMTFVAIVVWNQPGMRPLAIGCLGGGLLWSLSWVTTWNTSIFPVIGLMAGMWLYVFLGVGFILTASNGLSRVDRYLVRAFYIVATAQFLGLVVSEPEWSGYSPSAWWPTIVPSRDYFDWTMHAFSVMWAAIAIVFSYVSIRRIRSMKSLDRLVAVPVAVGFCLFGLFSGFSSGVEPYTPVRQSVFYFALSMIMLCIPMGLIVSMIRRFIRRAVLTEQLNRRLARRVLTGDVVRDEFRDLLKDPSLQLFYWSESDDAYVDTDGHVVSGDVMTNAGFAAYLANASAQPMAVVIGDAMVVDHMSMLDSFLAASALAIENVQLQASVKAQLEQVRASRARIVEATLEERRRIERDLHDGVQQRLLAIQLKVGAFRGDVASDAEALLDELANELREALASLRELAQGIHPTELRQFGIRGAIEVVAERFPLDIRLDITDRRFSAVVESTLYFVVCEALANIVKHAEARQVWVAITVDGADHISLTVTDDGNGHGRIRAGGGLQGLADRLRNLGGELDVRAGAGTGTALSSRFPIPPSN